MRMFPRISCAASFFILLKLKPIAVSARSPNPSYRKSRHRGHLCEHNDTISFGADVVITANAVLLENQPHHVMASAHETIVIGKTIRGVQRALLYFNLTSLAESMPSDVRIECAEVALSLKDDDGDSDESFRESPEITFHQIVSPWSMATTTPGSTSHSRGGGKYDELTAAQSGNVTWTYSDYPSSEWVHAGGDFIYQSLSRQSTAGYHNYFGSTPQMNRVIQGWIKGEIPNHGFALKGEEGAETPPSYYEVYHGIEHSPFYAPHLLIRYTAPSLGKPFMNGPDFHQPDMDSVRQSQGGDKANDTIVAVPVVALGVMVVVAVAVLVRRHRSRDMTVEDKGKVTVELAAGEANTEELESPGTEKELI